MTWNKVYVSEQMSQTGVSAGTYTKLTVDAAGRVTGATSITNAELPSPLVVVAASSSTVPIAAQAAASQTADLIQALASDGTTVLAKVDASGNLTAASLNTGGNVVLSGQLTLDTYRLTKVIRKTSFPDNSATSICRISTPNSGSEGGTYLCTITCLVTEPSGASGASAVASLARQDLWTRSMISTGTGVNSPLVNLYSTTVAATASAARSIGTNSVALVQTTQFDTDVQYTIDATGTSATTMDVTIIVEVLWDSFTSAPTITAL